MKKILITLCIIFILVPIILIVGIKAYLEITKQIDYSKNKKAVYDYINQEYGKEIELIRVEKEDYDFWTARTDTFYFKDKEKDFVFEIAIEYQEITDDTYNENKLGKEIEKEFYKTLPKDINLDFIFKAESYGSGKERKYSETNSDLYVFYDDKLNYEEIYELYRYIVNKFNGINIYLNISHVSEKQNRIKIINREKGYRDIETMPLLAKYMGYEKINNLNEFIDFINENSRVY